MGRSAAILGLACLGVLVGRVSANEPVEPSAPGSCPAASSAQRIVVHQPPPEVVFQYAPCPAPRNRFADFFHNLCGKNRDCCPATTTTSHTTTLLFGPSLMQSPGQSGPPQSGPQQPQSGPPAQYFPTHPPMAYGSPAYYAPPAYYPPAYGPPAYYGPPPCQSAHSGPPACGNGSGHGNWQGGPPNPAALLAGQRAYAEADARIRLAALRDEERKLSSIIPDLAQSGPPPANENDLAKRVEELHKRVEGLEKNLDRTVKSIEVLIDRLPPQK